MLVIVVGQVVALLPPAVKGKFQYLHAGKAGLPQQLPHPVGEKPQVLGNDGLAAQGVLHSPE